jgi:hypothetical protein
MSFWLVFFIAQVVVTVIAVAREAGKGHTDLDEDKLQYRS